MPKLHSKSDIIDTSIEVPCLVGTGRLELPRIAPYAPEAYAYTNSATCPRMYYKNSTVFNNSLFFSFICFLRIDYFVHLRLDLLDVSYSVAPVESMQIYLPEVCNLP